MEVVCPTCGTKYAVADQRIRNKRVKTPCRKCGTSIVIDGTSLGDVGKQSPNSSAQPKAPPTPANGDAQQASAPVSPPPKPSTPAVSGGGMGATSPKPGVPAVPRPAPPRPAVPRPVGARQAAGPDHSPAQMIGSAAVQQEQSADAPVSAVRAGVSARSNAAHDASAVQGHASNWLVDLGAEEPESMSTAEIAELYVRGAITNWTPVRDAEGVGEMKELISVTALREALSQRGVFNSDGSEVSQSRPTNEPPLAPGAKAAPIDLSAPTQTVDAAELWSAAGVAPLARRRRSATTQPEPAAGSESIKDDKPSPLARLTAPSGDDDATTLYRKESTDSVANTTSPRSAASARMREKSRLATPGAKILRLALMVVVSIAAIVIAWAIWTSF